MAPKPAPPKKDQLPSKEQGLFRTVVKHYEVGLSADMRLTSSAGVDNCGPQCLIGD